MGLPRLGMMRRTEADGPVVDPGTGEPVTRPQAPPPMPTNPMAMLGMLGKINPAEIMATMGNVAEAFQAMRVEVARIAATQDAILARLPPLVPADLAATDQGENAPAGEADLPLPVIKAE